MAAHRYWRALGLETYGKGALALSEFQLIAGTSRVDAAATLAANIAPASGSVASLKDDCTATSATWSAVAVSSLALSWDFGSGGDVDVSDICVGSVGSSVAAFLFAVRLQYSDDGTSWTEALAFASIAWPGVSAKSTSLDPTGRWSLLDHGVGMPVSADQYTLGAVNGKVQSGRGVVSKSAGIVQFEVTVSFTAGNDVAVGVGTSAANLENYVGSGAGGFSYNRNGNKYLAGAASAYGATYVSGDVIGVVVNFNTGSLTFYKNGISQGVASATGMLGLTLFPMVGQTSGGSSNGLFTMRGRGFTYPVAGASEWSGPPSVLRNLFGRIGGSETNGAVSLPLGAYPVSPSSMPKSPEPVGRLRKNYALNMLGQGSGVVNGTVKKDGSPDVPVRRRVRLIREIDGMVIDETWSHATTGAYQFSAVDELYSYTVVSYDHFHNFRAVVADGLTLANGGVELSA